MAPEGTRDPRIEPRVLNAGLRLLNQASRRGSPGGRLIRSGQLSSSNDEGEPPNRPKSAAQAAKSAPKVKVERVEVMRFPEESVAEVASLQAPPPVDAAPAPAHFEPHPREFVQPSASTPRKPAGPQPSELVQPSDSPARKPVEIDLREFLEQLDLPEELQLDSREFLEPPDQPKPERVQTDLREVAQKGDRPTPEPARTGSHDVIQKRDQPKPEPARTGSRDVIQKRDQPKPERERARTVPRQVATRKRDLPRPEPVVVAELGQADLVWEPPEPQDDDPERPANPAGKAKSGSMHQKPYRDFIIAYDGVFIGHFRSRRRITNRTAFQQVARQLHSTTSSFDVRKLQLYRPVPVDVEISESLSEISDGAFMWFADRQPQSDDPA